MNNVIDFQEYRFGLFVLGERGQPLKRLSKAFQKCSIIDFEEELRKRKFINNCLGIE